MSLTGAHHAFVAAHEDGMNVIIEAFRIARPRLFSYGSSALGGGLAPAPTSLMSDITIPGTSVAFPIRIDFPFLKIDCFPANPGSGLPPELTPLAVDEFSIEAIVELTVLCCRRVPDPDISTHEPQECEELTAKLALWAIGSPTATPAGGGVTNLGLTVRAVEIVEIDPNELENILECLLKMILDQAVLPRITFALDKITTDFFTLVLADGPHVDEDRIFALGDVL